MSGGYFYILNTVFYELVMQLFSIFLVYPLRSKTSFST